MQCMGGRENFGVLGFGASARAALCKSWGIVQEMEEEGIVNRLQRQIEMLLSKYKARIPGLTLLMQCLPTSHHLWLFIVTQR